MRISTSMITSNFLRNLKNNLNKTMEYQEKAATGKRISRLSEDPVGVVSVMSSKMKLYRVEQYQKNIDTTDDFTKQTEESVLQLNEMIKTAIETTTQASNGTLSAEDKEAIGILIGQYRDEALEIGNSEYSGRRIFGGYNTSEPPFTFGGSGELLYNGFDLSDDTNPGLIDEMNNVVEFEIGPGKNIKAAFTGAELFGTGDDNIYAVLDDLYEKLMSDAPSDEISPYLDKLQDSQSQLLSLEAEIGGVSNRLELLSSRYDRDWLNYTEKKSLVEDIDIADAMMQFSQANAIYTASLQISSKIIQPSLVDYLN